MEGRKSAGKAGHKGPGREPDSRAGAGAGENREREAEHVKDERGTLVLFCSILVLVF